MGGNGSKQRIAETDAVRSELLASSLLGKLDDDDYLGISTEFLDSFVVDSPVQSECRPENVIDILHVHTLTQESSFALENGYVRGSNGIWYVACKVDLGEITGVMFDWWFRVCDNSERFKWWHPRANKSLEWDLPIYAKQLGERRTGSYVDHVQTVMVDLDGQTRKLTLDFDRPSKHFDISRFHTSGVTACICARIHMFDDLVGWIGIGHVIYLVTEERGRSTLRVRFWIGDINKVDDNSLCHPSFVNWFGNTQVFRLTRITESLASSFWRHCHEEMACLKSFLPRYYDKSSKEGHVFEMANPVAVNDVEVDVRDGEDLSAAPETNFFYV